MIELLQTYSIAELLAILVTVALAIKKLIEFCTDAVEWLRKKFGGEVKKELDASQREKEIDEKFEQVQATMQEQTDALNDVAATVASLQSQLTLLLDSDKDDIKAFITKDHHYFCYQKGWIDDYSMDCLERRYQHYVDERGNSFVADLMKDLCALKRQPQ